MQTGAKGKKVKLNTWQLLEELLRKYRLILLCGAVCGLIVFVLTCFIMPHYYESAAYFGLETPVFKAGRTPTTNERHAFEEKVADCDALLRTEGAVEELMAYVSEGTDRQMLMDMIYTEPDLDTALIRVAVRGEDAGEVGRLAEKIGRLLPKLSVVEPVYRKSVDAVPEKPVTPKVLRDTVNAVIVGLALGASWVVLNLLFRPGASDRRKRKGTFETGRSNVGR